MDLGIHPVTLSKWVKQDRIDRGEIPGTPSSESVELRAAPPERPHASTDEVARSRAGCGQTTGC
ncbi:hypothetical protein C8D88_105420 [Lentzea atacamensis]|uniref:Transposase n=1 Tax=Lentzea atacamensis TaxID=531938 RepID=A0A316I105_9PSEU|nr:hypothetical protein C8D88_105420 [Lentzea atacamensis]